MLKSFASLILSRYPFWIVSFGISFPFLPLSHSKVWQVDDGYLCQWIWAIHSIGHPTCMTHMLKYMHIMEVPPTLNCII